MRVRSCVPGRPSPGGSGEDQYPGKGKMFGEMGAEEEEEAHQGWDNLGRFCAEKAGGVDGREKAFQ